MFLRRLYESWTGFENRHLQSETEWLDRLSRWIDGLVSQRVDHVNAWINSNLGKFSSSNAAIQELRRAFEAASVEMKRNVQLCKMECSNCQLLCIEPRFHGERHSCDTDHACKHSCAFEEAHLDEWTPCGLGCVFLRTVTAGNSHDWFLSAPGTEENIC